VFQRLAEIWLAPLRQPHSIRVHLTAVFLVFFALVVVLGLFSIWRLNRFNLLSADVAEVWLPTTRALGDLNNFSSDFRAIEGSILLSSTPAEAASSESQMEALDRSIADAERSFERIRHNSAEAALYDLFKERWNDYRAVVNRMVQLARNGGRADAVSIYRGASRAAYDSASDTLSQLTDKTVANAQAASDRLAVAYRQAFWLIVLGILIAAVMVVAALLHVSRLISDPLLRLARGMRRLAANDTEIDIADTDRFDEIGEMAKATVVFRNNAIELVRSQRMLARQAGILEEKLAQEQRIALMQRNFVSMASHEFRTPLTVIDGHARRLIKARDNAGAAEIDERGGKIRAAVLRLTHLIDNLLNSARIIDGGAELYYEPGEFDLTALLQEVCQLHHDMVPAAQIASRLPAEPIKIIGDQKLLYQAFSNLLSNAVKYSPAGGLIEVRAQNADGAVAVEVADHGIGIPPGDLERLFRRYHRGSNVSGIVGTGVGLYLVKMAIDRHGGAVAVRSKEGEGTCFTITLPVSAKGPLAAGAEPRLVTDVPSITLQ
jgi:signal transduction histidine kinase